jgi:methionyl aminopeptidase
MPRINTGVSIKTADEIETMQEGGKKLSEIKNAIKKVISVGSGAKEVEETAQSEIKKSGGKASFAMVPGYSWATCVNLNEGVVHGIPHQNIKFKKGDLVSVDVGLYYKGFHTDTSFSIGLEVDKRTRKFMDTGELALKEAIKESKSGNKIYDLSQAMQQTLEKEGLSPVRTLVGHGIGRSLHEEPQIPCFVYGNRSDSLDIVEGMVFAIEVMYTRGNPKVVMYNDGWTLAMASGKISALYEETVAVTSSGPLVLT